MSVRCSTVAAPLPSLTSPTLTFVWQLFVCDTLDRQRLADCCKYLSCHVCAFAIHMCIAQKLEWASSICTCPSAVCVAGYIVVLRMLGILSSLSLTT